MEYDNDRNRVEQTVEDLKEYTQLQLERLKLRLLASFATLFNNIFSAFLLIILASFVLIFLAGAFTLWLGVLINSLPGAMLITAGVFLVGFFVVFAMRHKLIINQMVRMLGKIMFETENDMDNE